MADELDIISPRTIGSDQIVITIDPVSEPLLVSRAISIDFDYSATSPGGVVLPLKLTVQPAFGLGVGYFTKIFRRQVPSSFAFQVLSAGEYLILLQECGHNFWQGRILIEVAGEEFSQIQSARQTF